jgi:polysaccharide biosynthesis PFTS motif protein
MIRKLLFILFLGLGYKKKVLISFRILKKKNQINLINKIKNEFINTKLRFNFKCTSLSDLNYHCKEPELSKNFTLKTYTSFISFLFTSLLIVSLAGGKRLIYPMPSAWAEVLLKNNIVTNVFICNIFFKFVILFSSLYFFFFNILIIFHINTKKKISNYFYLSNIPKISNVNNGPNLFSWCKKFFVCTKKIKFVHENIQIKNFSNNDYETFYLNKFFLVNINLYQRVYFIYLNLKFIFLFAKYFFTNKSNLFILFDDFVRFAFLNKYKKKLPHKALFNISSINRPLWTFLLKKKNSVFFYFYSINHIPLIFKRGEFSVDKIYDHVGYKLFTWNNYIGWSKKQLNWISKQVNNKAIKLIDGDYVPFEGENIVITNPKKIISVFDVSPCDPFYYALLGLKNNPYTLNYCMKFIKDIIDVTKKLDCVVMIKSKRFSTILDKNYHNFLSKIEKSNSNVFIINSVVSAQSLASVSKCVLSMPFSSPALISKRMNIPSVYYDPSSLLNNCLYQNSEVSLLKKKLTLRNWIKSNL